MACHSRAANFVLGPSELQMDRDHVYGSERENQMSALHRLGVLTDWPPAPPKEADKPKYTPGKLVNPYDTSEDLDKRARSYLHTNCSVCHVEAGGGNAKMQLEFTQPPDEMSLLSARPQHDTFGLANAMLVALTDPDRSILLDRVSRRGRGQMPPLVTSQVDQRAVDLLREWIRQMKPDSVFVRAWTMDDLVPELDQVASGRSFDSGKSAFQKVGCAQCHRFAGDGGTVGSDLTGISRRAKIREIVESLIEPSKVVADEYASFIFATESGKIVTGRIEREDARELVIRTGPGNDDVARLAKSDIAARRKSPVSNMPAEILNVLDKNQILDLLAYLLSEGDADAAAFK
jgi:putative heme-binding domain-containing protein